MPMGCVFFDCLVGGMIGDAAGATLEFIRYEPTDDHVRHALTLPGGGPHRVAPGQVTDDSELMIALLTALSDHPTFPDAQIAERYIEWHKSRPFDIGMTCNRAFGFAKDHVEVAQNAQRYNLLSEANGALMRCAPIACWGIANEMTVSDIMAAARKDANLSHPSAACLDANAMLCGILAIVIRHRRESRRETASHALRCLKEWQFGHPVAKWIDDAIAMPDLATYSAECRINAGHVKHAVVLLIWVLRRFSTDDTYTYENALFDAIKVGGDTDTNACICGYLAGAIDGPPHHMVRKVMECDCNDGIWRPDTYAPRNVPRLLQKTFVSRSMPTETAQKAAMTAQK